MFRWLRDRPAVFALFTASVMIVAGLVIFHDLRPALIGGALGAAFMYLAWSPGGFGWRLDARQRQILEKRGDVGVRPAWLLRAGLVVIAVVVVLLLMALVAS
jgi:hypothetical protein